MIKPAALVNAAVYGWPENEYTPAVLKPGDSGAAWRAGPRVARITPGRTQLFPDAGVEPRSSSITRIAGGEPDLSDSVRKMIDEQDFRDERGEPLSG
jgi:hypothetical protein